MSGEAELYFDHLQAREIVTFLESYRERSGVVFRLMTDVFPHSLDLTAYDEDGHEITHIHPQGKGTRL